MISKPKTKVDFEALFNLWITTGLHYIDFFEGTGLDAEIDGDRLNALGRNDWLPRLRTMVKSSEDYPSVWRQTLYAKRQGGMCAGDIHVPRVIDKVVALPVEAKVVDPAECQADTEKWLDIQRPKQGLADWYTAERIKDAINQKLRFAYVIMDDEVSGQQVRVPILSCTDLRQLVGAYKDLQTMQRLALGLSSDNVGLPVTPQAPPNVRVFFGKEGEDE